MRISVNLASRPFVELRPFFLRLRITMAVLLALAIGLGIWLHSENAKLAQAEAQMQALQAQTNAARQEKTRNELRMRQPANAAVLERAHFLNALFLAKSFSWTAVLMDLENVLPVGVQVTSIEPSTTADGEVIIRLRVAGDRDRAVQLVRNLERSRRFLLPRLSGETSQVKDSGGANGGRPVAVNPAAPAGVEFEILANYNPVPPDEPYLVGKAPRAAKPSAVPSAPKRAKQTNGLYPRDGVVLKPYVSPRPANAAGGRVGGPQ